MKLKRTVAVLAAVLAAAAVWGIAAPRDTVAQTQAAAMSDGEVKKINKDAGKITIKHGELKNLDMPPMTMVFRVKDPAMLDKVKAGDSVRFNVERIDGQLTVTAIEPK